MPWYDYNRRVGFDHTRLVWAAVSTGARGERAICEATGLKRAAIYRALRHLENAGYIVRADTGCGGLTVIVPLIIIGKES